MGFENRIFISAESFSMSSSNSSLRGKFTLDRSISPMKVSSSVAAFGVTFGDNTVQEFDPQAPSAAPVDEGRDSPLVDLDSGDDQLSEIAQVGVPQGTQLSDDMERVIWSVNFAINAINGFVNHTTSLDPSQIARALRNHVRFQDRDNERHVRRFLNQLMSNLQKIGYSNFNIMHPANFVTLISLGFDENEAKLMLEFLRGKTLKSFDGKNATPRDRMCWFWIIATLCMRTILFQMQNGTQTFYDYASNPTANPLQANFQQVANEARLKFQSSVHDKTVSDSQKRKEIRGDSSVAGSDISSMTQVGGFLWKYHTAFNSLSKLLNEWLSGNKLLRTGKFQLSEEALITLVYRLLAKMQCSKTGDFGTDRAYSSHIYTTLMAAYWKAQKKNTRFVARPLETFSSIMCATGNYDAAIEWLNRALKCQHPKKGDLTPAEVAVLNFAFISMSLGVQSLASCTSDNLEALFAHIFDGADLEVDESEAPKFQSAIDHVAEHFSKEPEAVSKDQIDGLRSRGGQAHRASPAARNTELEAMIRAVAADPEKKAEIMKWLTEEK
jgi:hypothetical protein